MRLRTLGTTGIEVSELSLGTWGLSGEAYGPVAEAEAVRILERARAMGVTLYETADSYAAGRIETNLGQVLEGSKSVVVTKWGTDLKSSPPRKRFTASYIEKCAEESRRRLGDSVKLVGLLHNPSPTALRDGDSVEALRKMTDAGTIESWGVSVGDEEVGRAALDVEAPIISLPYNILHVALFRAVQEGIVAKQTAVLAHSVLFYGLLAGRWAPNKDFRSYDHRAERWAGGALRERVGHLAAVRPLVSGEVTTMRAAAVRFVLENSHVSSAVLGPRSTAQLDQLIRECRAEPPYLSPAKMSSLEGRLAELGVAR